MLAQVDRTKRSQYLHKRGLNEHNEFDYMFFVPECCHKGVNSSIGEKTFFQFPRFLLRGKQAKVKSSRSPPEGTQNFVRS